MEREFNSGKERYNRAYIWSGFHTWVNTEKLQVSWQQFEGGDLPFCSALIRQNPECHAQFWAPQTKKDMRQVQHRAARMIKGLEHWSYEERLKAQELHSWEKRRLGGDLSMYKDLMRGNEEEEVNLFLVVPLDRTRGNGIETLKIPSDHKQTFFFAMRVVKIGTNCPQRWCRHHLRRYSKLNWTVLQPALADPAWEEKLD